MPEEGTHDKKQQPTLEVDEEGLRAKYDVLPIGHAVGAVRSLSAIPPPSLLAARLRGVEAHRAPGPDLAQNAALKAAPDAVLPHLQAITAKIGLLCQERSVRKAAMACALHKGRLGAMTAELYRSATLNSDVI